MNSEMISLSKGTFKIRTTWRTNSKTTPTAVTKDTFVLSLVNHLIGRAPPIAFSIIVSLSVNYGIRLT
jgi:hypothetical protein